MHIQDASQCKVQFEITLTSALADIKQEFNHQIFETWGFLSDLTKSKFECQQIFLLGFLCTKRKKSCFNKNRKNKNDFLSFVLSCQGS